MAVITLTIPDTDLPDIQAALCQSANLPNTGPNAKASIIKIALDITAQYRAGLIIAANQATIQATIATAKAINVT